MKLLFWARDVRGAGERQVFKDIINILQKIELKLYVKFKPYSRVWKMG
jgi:hypothetical protein